MLVPDTVLQNRYRIVRRLAKGGMGAVYEAIYIRLNAPVAIKESLFTDEELLRQFEHEARMLASLNHQALPNVSEYFTEGDRHFLVMQFIPGDDLEEMRKKRGGVFPPEQVLEWADQLLDALDYLHTQEPPVIHRDIKPHNLKVTSRGHLFLLDFGLAKGSAGVTTTPESIAGFTRQYAPPEQIYRTGTDERSDLYSLAATVYHLITGMIPSDADVRTVAARSGAPDPLCPAMEINPSISPDISAILQRAMALNREERPANAAEMRAALVEARKANVLRSASMVSTLVNPSGEVTLPLGTMHSPMSEAAEQAAQKADDEISPARKALLAEAQRITDRQQFEEIRKAWLTSEQGNAEARQEVQNFIAELQKITDFLSESNPTIQFIHEDDGHGFHIVYCKGISLTVSWNPGRFINSLEGSGLHLTIFDGRKSLRHVFNLKEPSEIAYRRYDIDLHQYAGIVWRETNGDRREFPNTSELAELWTRIMLEKIKWQGEDTNFH